MPENTVVDAFCAAMMPNAKSTIAQCQEVANILLIMSKPWPIGEARAIYIECLRGWLEKEKLGVGPVPFAPLQNLEEKYQKKLAKDMQVEQGLENLKETLTDILKYLMAGREQQDDDDEDGADDVDEDELEDAEFWKKHAEDAPGGANAVEQGAPAAAAGGGDAPLAAAVIPKPEGAKQAAQDAKQAFQVIARHDAQEPAIVIKGAAATSRTTAIMSRLCQHGTVSRKLLLQLVLSIAETNEPSGVVTSIPGRDFLFDHSQKVHRAGGVYTGPAERNRTTVWNLREFRITETSLGNPTNCKAKLLLSALCARGSFDPNLQLGEGDAGKCLIIDAAALDGVATINGFSSIARGAQSAVAHMCKELFACVDIAEDKRIQTGGTSDRTFLLSRAAFDKACRADIRSGIEDVVENACEMAHMTSISHRDRLVAVPLVMMMSRGAMDYVVGPEAEDLATTRGMTAEDGQNFVWRRWLQDFVTQGEVSLFVDDTTVESWLGEIPVLAPRVVAEAAYWPPPPFGHAAAHGAVTSASYPAAQQEHRCTNCGKLSHHAADCYYLTKPDVTEETIRQAFNRNKAYAASGAPPQVAKPGTEALPKNIDTRFEVFAKRVARNVERSKTNQGGPRGTKRPRRA
mgnify:CR=1 FL=1